MSRRRPRPMTERDLSHLVGVRARFDGDCARCPSPILIDQRVIRHGDAWIHATCASGQDE